MTISTLLEMIGFFAIAVLVHEYGSDDVRTTLFACTAWLSGFLAWKFSELEDAISKNRAKKGD